MGKASRHKREQTDEKPDPKLWLPAERGRPIGQLQTSVPGLHFNFAVDGPHGVSVQEMSERLVQLVTDPDVHVLRIYSPIDAKWHYLTKHGASIVFAVLDARVLDADEWADVAREAQDRGTARRDVDILRVPAAGADLLRVKH